MFYFYGKPETRSVVKTTQATEGRTTPPCGQAPGQQAEQRARTHLPVLEAGGAHGVTMGL